MTCYLTNMLSSSRRWFPEDDFHPYRQMRKEQGMKTQKQLAREYSSDKRLSNAEIERRWKEIANAGDE